MTDLNQMTVEQLLAVPHRNKDTDLSKAFSIVIMPMPANELPPSGYRAMDFVAVTRGGEPICRLSGFSDVLHIDGIGGFGRDWLKRYGTVPQAVPPSGWSFDCLAVSGLLRLFPSTDSCDGIEVDDMSFSSFEVFGKQRLRGDAAVSQVVDEIRPAIEKLEAS